ncbi:MAG TPA: cell division protein ZapE, partial [Hyphomonas atlantica]|nr:cell division protein ZapE [Hyphomonas atlantica]
MGYVIERYEARISDGQLMPDPVQAEAAAALDDLAHRLANRKTGGWFSKAETVTGLYMWGGVARGKSMLMDLFFEHA